MNEPKADEDAGQPSWDDLDQLPPCRLVDSIELDLALGRSSELRDRVLAAPKERRSVLLLDLQAKAATIELGPLGAGRGVLQLLALPIVLGYETEVAARAQPSLFSSRAALAARWQAIWERLVPNAEQIWPATSCVLLEDLIGVGPDQVHACLQAGVARLQENPRPQLRASDGSRRKGPAGHYAVGGPVAATYLSLAYALTPEAGQGSACRAPDGAVDEVARLLQGLFAVRREVPTVKVYKPAPFFEAMRAATTHRLRHFVEWGNEHDPAWSLDFLALEQATQVEVLGSFALPGNLRAPDDTPHVQVMRWEWDRLWWTDEHIERLKAEVNASEIKGLGRPGRPVLRPVAGASGSLNGCLH